MNITTNHPPLKLSDLSKCDAVAIQANLSGMVYAEYMIGDDWKYHGNSVASLREANEAVDLIMDNIKG